MTYEKKSLKDYPSLKDKCPFFKHNMCFSPVLNLPSSTPVNPDRCLTILYKTCLLYEKGVEKNAGQKRIRDK